MEITTMGPAEIRELISMRDAVDAVREGFLALHRGEFEMPTRTVLRDGGFLVMSVHHRPSSSAMIKTLSLNFDRSPAIVGTVTWSEFGHTDHLVADAMELTRIRTGAVSGVATDLMAPPEAATCTVIGAGGQAADQARAVQAVRPLSRLHIVSRNSDKAEALAARLREELPIADVTSGTDVEKGVRDVDVVCCATTSTTPLFPADAIAAHTHVNAIGAFRPTMRELPDELLTDSVVVIDELEAILEEAGDVLHALDAGAVTRDRLVELGPALADGIGPRTGRTVFKSVGVALQDWAIARILADRALRR
ncbi:ornithine cyclodeaminase family protein [Pseudonocardia nematodicida]|uniref:Ornithine cyclodeaminase family protein n=1 Tax=Pseudonocardia nematodicida TaxID=1206997 RepID=A0ABV1K6W4_9PSEU